MRPLVSAVLLLAAAGLGGDVAVAQVPANCPETGVCDDMTYALCIAASCNPETGQCGVMEVDGGWVACDQAGLDAGTCGPCYVLTGQSCSYRVPCSELDPDTLYSTYSEALLDDYGFRWTACPDEPAAFDCMDGACARTGQTVTVDGQEIETAICQCKTSEGGSVQVNDCAVDHCSALWSTAGLECTADAECCSGSCVGGRCEATD